MTRNSLSRLAFAVVVGSIFAGVGTACEARTEAPWATPMQEDLASRSPDIHWPAGFEPAQADLFSHNSLQIHAACADVWGHIVDAVQWPQWYPNAKDVRIVSGEKALEPGSVFR